MRQITELSHADAMTIIESVRAELERDGLGASVAVVDSHGELIAFLRTDGCRLTSITIALNKAYTAAREQCETWEVGQAARENQFPLTNYGDTRIVGWGGGAPVIRDGKCVGAVGVSGLPEDVDMGIVRRAVKLLGE